MLLGDIIYHPIFFPYYGEYKDLIEHFYFLVEFEIGVPGLKLFRDGMPLTEESGGIYKEASEYSLTMNGHRIGVIIWMDPPILTPGSGDKTPDGFTYEQTPSGGYGISLHASTDAKSKRFQEFLRKTIRQIGLVPKEICFFSTIKHRALAVIQ